MSIPDNAIGYCGIIMSALDEFQGFYLVDSPIDRAMVKKMLLLAMTSGSDVYGALQAAIADGYLTGREDVVRIGAMAYASLTKDKFFYIIARREPNGIRTEAKSFQATTLSGCRDEMHQLPEVLLIKARLADKVRREKRH